MNPQQPELTHAGWCVDPTVRTTESIFNRGVDTYRCLGCGAWTTRRRPGRAPT